ncbi:calcium-binding protein CML24-like [Chenopodium quinoa]|uniref:calcium-binding protein CML24-like n=1 Tax=Chenopodium quinoa TaxID=63459 RepID=UPI000B794CEC|nr:calcium-binding protein CML24-like [Chenopodium quinoa]
MLKSIKTSLISTRKSMKALVYQHKILKKLMKVCKSKSKNRGFNGFDGMKASFASMKMSRQLELVFKFIDANGDGKISPHELREFLLCFGHDKSKVGDEVATMLKHLDANGDGYVDLNEYMNVFMISDHRDHDHDVVDGEDDVFVDEDHDDDGGGGFEEDDLMDAFLVFDCDKNGLISAKELHHVLKRLGFANCSIKECNLMIKGVDKDGDGFVNFDEFRLMMMGYAW